MKTNDAASSPGECLLCDWVLVAVGVLVGGLVLFMSADLATGGRLSAAIVRGGRAGLATVTELKAEAGDAPAS